MVSLWPCKRSRCNLAIPKSPSRARSGPPGSCTSSTLAGLISRWVIFASWWASSSTDATGPMRFTISSNGSAPLRASNSSSEPPAQYSINMYMRPSGKRPASNTFTMLGSCSLPVTNNSARKRFIDASSFVHSADNTFTAASLPANSDDEAR